MVQRASLASLPTQPPGVSTLPMLDWDGRAPTALIGQIEARLAAGTRFVVLAATTPLGRAADRNLLDGWWRIARPRLSGRCAGWAVVVAGADIRPGRLPADDTLAGFDEFPVRTCADRAEALWWLRSRLAKAEPGRSLLQ